MKKTLKVKNLFQWTAAILFASTLAMSCQSGEPSSEEPPMENATVAEPAPATQSVADSVPPLNKDTGNSTRPETIKNPTSGTQK